MAGPAPEPTVTGAAIAATGLSHDYGPTRALDDLDLRVRPGELVGVIGPDGVGKSTLLGLVAGARRMQRGRMEVLGCDLRQRPARRKVSAQLGYLPQGLGASLYPELSARENLKFSARVFGIPPDQAGGEIDRLLAATGLADAERRPARTLSGGMKQKLGLCCALVHRPRLLVLDEPTTGVDPLSRRGFWRLIGDLRVADPELAVLVATSYMDEAEPFDHLVLLSGGRALARGSAQELCHRTGVERLEEAYGRLIVEKGSGQAGRSSIGESRRPHLEITHDRPIVIEAREVGRRFGSVVAVDRVSFRVSRGEIFGFVGPNGSGKTTTMKMLTGILPPSVGESDLLGETVTGKSLRQRRHTGYMSQGFSLRKDLTARENLRLYGRLLDLTGNEIATRTRELAQRYDFERYLTQRVEAVPLGVRQRLSLAVALLHAPPILVLDEPTSGTDPLAREEFWASIEWLTRNEGMTVLVSTHYLSEAARCDRVALMNAGRVLACDAPDELVRSAGASDLEEAFATWIGRDEARRGDELPGVDS